MPSTLYSRAATAVERAVMREPNNEKITREDVLVRAAELPDDDPLASSLPGSLGNLAQQLRNAVGIMSESEMAAILQVSDETLATWRTKKKGPPHVKIGKRAFYLAGDFSKWVLEEVQRQAALNTSNEYRRRTRVASASNPCNEDDSKRKQETKGKAREKRKDDVTGADAQASLPTL
jgi:hypothetical protein